MKEKFKLLEEELQKKFDTITNKQELNDLRVEYQGKKGIITELSAKIKEVEPENKKEYGMLVNSLRTVFYQNYH